MAALQRLSTSIIAPVSSQPRSRFHLRRTCRLLPFALAKQAITRRQLIGCLRAAAAVSLSALGRKALAAEDPMSESEKVTLLIEPDVVVLDNDLSHGFVLGTRQTILETTRSIPSAEDDDFNYRFNSISFKGNEGWIIGEPAILLYTANAGENWKRIPLSALLPGDVNQWSRKSSYKEERPRFFDAKAKRICWDKAKKLPGRDPERWRVDAAGNIVCKRLHTCNGCLCYEYDHITPFSKGGESVADNCQILQTRVNRLKSDKNGIDQKLLEGYSCNIKFSDEQLDLIEMVVYGSVVRPGRQCVVGSISSLIGKYSSRDRAITCNSTQK